MVKNVSLAAVLIYLSFRSVMMSSYEAERVDPERFFVGSSCGIL
jgi:hypothetical protein